MYLDVSKKIKIIEEEILKDYIENNKYPDINEIEKMISDINPYKPLYSPIHFTTGEYLSQAKLNREQEQIYKDLKVLYETMFELSVKEYIDLQSYLDTQIEELNRVVSQFKNRSSILSGSTMMGKTILDKKDDFKITNKIDHLEMDLGNIEYTPGSYVSVLLESSNLKEENILITIGDKKIRPYNLNKDVLYIPNINKNIITYDFEFEENEILKSPLNIPLKNDSKNKPNKYILSTGYNKVLCKNINTEKMEDIDNLQFEEDTSISFYCVGVDSIEIYSNKEFISSNIDQSNSINKINSYIRKISISVSKGTIINLKYNNGEIYAIREEGILVNDMLYYGHHLYDKKFVIEEVYDSEKIPMNTKVNIYIDKSQIIGIDRIMIKEMKNIGGAIDD